MAKLVWDADADAALARAPFFVRPLARRKRRRRELSAGDRDRADVIARAQHAGVVAMIVTGSTLADSARALSLPEGRYQLRMQAPRCVTGTDTITVAPTANGMPITRRFPLICS